ncbi:hypothetical protein [Streptomyces africanus]|uniref:hypothetical protein n=1 Tax=Streptomyces africanus TaxID=231024 RepID=UPI0027D8BBD4|nr:hypothetical protein [Streptomyces africanus]
MVDGAVVAGTVVTGVVVAGALDTGGLLAGGGAPLLTGSPVGGGLVTCRGEELVTCGGELVAVGGALLLGAALDADGGTEPVGAFDGG